MNLATLSFAAMLGRRNAIKFGAKVVRHGRYVAFQMAAAAVPRYLFAGTPRLIAEPRPPPQPQRRQVFDPQVFAQTPWERYVLMLTKSPMSGARRTDLTRFRGASPRGTCLAKIRRTRQSHPRQGRHPLDEQRRERRGKPSTLYLVAAASWGREKVFE